MNVAVSRKKQQQPFRQCDQLLEFLKSQSSYPHRPIEVRSIETHISWVFITSPFVFKIKKPVSLGFLDFSSLEKRHHFCQRELELNRRLCPEVYLEVVPIYKGASGYSFKTGGQIAEYSVKMKELPDGWFLRQLLARHVVRETEINRVISRLHRFYESQTPAPQIEEWGKAEKLKISTDENFAQVEPCVGKTISQVAFDAIRHFTNNFYCTNNRLFRERVRQRRIRDCHGDLHLDHIHLTPHATTIFDCIEFNDRFRFIDIANDLAFLAMDFDFEWEHKLGDLFLRNAAREFSDPGILNLADFYKCYRAIVRGKVESIQAIAEDPTPRENHANRATRYFHLALRYAVVGSEPLVLVVMGRIATGKSTVAKQLARELDWPLFSSDEIRKTLAGLPLNVRTPPKLHDELYSERMTDQTYEKLLQNGLAALAIDNGVVLDATFSSRRQREHLRKECARAAIRLRMIELQAHPKEIKRKLKARERAVGQVSDARLEDFEKLTANYEAPSEVAELIGVSTAGSALDTVKVVLLSLAEKQSVTWPS
jgi:aminoglycoside phosphotransferase family enzyme/predicted kinase